MAVRALPGKESTWELRTRQLATTHPLTLIMILNMIIGNYYYTVTIFQHDYTCYHSWCLFLFRFLLLLPAPETLRPQARRLDLNPRSCGCGSHTWKGYLRGFAF